MFYYTGKEHKVWRNLPLRKLPLSVPHIWRGIRSQNLSYFNPKSTLFISPSHSSTRSQLALRFTKLPYGNYYYTLKMASLNHLGMHMSAVKVKCWMMMMNPNLLLISQLSFLLFVLDFHKLHS